MQSQLHCLLISTAAPKQWHPEVASSGFPKPSQVVVNNREDTNCRAHKALM